MSRIRQIKPHFLRSGSMERVSRDAQLTFVRLWLLADDAGRVEDHYLKRPPPSLDPRYGLAPKLYPGQKDAWPLVEGWLDELDREGCIVRYTVEDDAYVRVVNWRKHQRISHPTKSRLPAESAVREELLKCSRATQESPARIAAEALPDNDSKAILANSGATPEALAKKPAEAANGGRLGGFRERLARIF